MSQAFSSFMWALCQQGATFLPWQLADIQEEGSRVEASVSVQTASWGVLNLQCTLCLQAQRDTV